MWDLSPNSQNDDMEGGQPSISCNLILRCGLTQGGGVLDLDILSKYQLTGKENKLLNQ